VQIINKPIENIFERFKIILLQKFWKQKTPQFLIEWVKMYSFNNPQIVFLND